MEISPKWELKKQDAKHIIPTTFCKRIYKPNRIENLLIKVILCMVYLFSRGNVVHKLKDRKINFG